MTETTFYFVRHGETDHNRHRIVQGRGVDAPLNATGRRQAEAVARRLAGIGLDALYASPLRRAAATAEAIAAQHPAALPVTYLPDLEEMAWGIHEGAPPSEQRQALFDHYRARWQAGALDLAVEGGESIRDVERRARRAVRTMTEQQAGGTVAVVTHGRFLRVLLASHLDGYRLEQMDEIAHANTGVYAVVCRGGRFEARLHNCTAHLDAAPETAQEPYL
ncbi:MAG: histidine phosphatase family protein [Rhodothermales bacterium]|nr:histidine phosphatase family protein [Rhodothermales bacterium]